MSIYRDFCEETFDEQGVLTEFRLKYSENYNFGYDVVDRIAAQTPDKTALVWCSATGEERIFSFAEMQRLSNQTANALALGGVRKGDRVMVALKRNYEYWYCAVALHKLGAVLIPVTHMLTAKDIAYRVNSAEIAAVIATPEGDVLDRIDEVRAECPSLRKFWTVRQSRQGFENLTEQIAQASAQFARVDTHVHEPMIMYFTSGTTGFPKGVMHDHTYTLAHILTAVYWQQVVDGGLHFTVAETGWGKASWGKIYGQWLAGSAVMVYDFDNFDPRQLVHTINRYGVTTFCAPPTVYRYLVKKGVGEMPSLRHASTAGEALNTEVFRRFYEATGIALAEGYGQTESTLMLANLRGMTARPGSMGKPTPLYHVELVREDGSPCQGDEVGEVVVVPSGTGRQDGIFCGYCGNDELYAHVWRDGVYHTGDTARRDGEGYFWFHGRIDDVIKTGGFRVGPFEIENVLMEHPAVMECSVVGVPDPLRGQAIKAVVVLAPGYTASPELQREIRDTCNHRLAEYKWIRIVEFVASMPRTISGKIRKTEQR